MSVTLNLGVIDLHYADAGSYPKAGMKRPHKISSGSLTTGDVAEILESEYHVFETFWGKYGQQTGDDMAQAYIGALEALQVGRVIRDPLGQVTSKIERRFKQFLTNKEMDGLQPGVPTQAAQEGHSKRFKRSRAARAPRPSFVDSGLYRASSKAWFTYD